MLFVHMFIYYVDCRAAKIHFFYMGDKFFLMKDGEIKYAGGEEVITPAVIKDVYGINSRIIELDHKKVVLGGKYYENEENDSVAAGICHDAGSMGLR